MATPTVPNISKKALKSVPAALAKECEALHRLAVEYCTTVGLWISRDALKYKVRPNIDLVGNERKAGQLRNVDVQAAEFFNLISDNDHAIIKKYMGQTEFIPSFVRLPLYFHILLSYLDRSQMKLARRRVTGTKW